MVSSKAKLAGLKIVSGGQTGVDRAALDIAMTYRISCGGWCPRGRLDEYGRIPRCYPVKELSSGGFRERTLQNVIDSDGTVIIYTGRLQGGTKQTVRFCREEQRPYKLINAAIFSPGEAGKAIGRFVYEHNIRVVNIAGPRESEWREGYEFTSPALTSWIVTQRRHPSR